MYGAESQFRSIYAYINIDTDIDIEIDVLCMNCLTREDIKKKELN